MFSSQGCPPEIKAVSVFRTLFVNSPLSNFFRFLSFLFAVSSVWGGGGLAWVLSIREPTLFCYWSDALTRFAWRENYDLRTSRRSTITDRVLFSSLFIRSSSFFNSKVHGILIFVLNLSFPKETLLLIQITKPCTSFYQSFFFFS